MASARPERIAGQPRRQETEDQHHRHRRGFEKGAAGAQHAAAILHQQQQIDGVAVIQDVVDRPGCRHFEAQDAGQDRRTGRQMKHAPDDVRAGSDAAAHDVIGQSAIEPDIDGHPQDVGHAGAAREQEDKQREERQHRQIQHRARRGAPVRAQPQAQRGATGQCVVQPEIEEFQAADRHRLIERRQQQQGEQIYRGDPLAGACEHRHQPGHDHDQQRQDRDHPRCQRQADRHDERCGAKRAPWLRFQQGVEDRQRGAADDGDEQAGPRDQIGIERDRHDQRHDDYRDRPCHRFCPERNARTARSLGVCASGCPAYSRRPHAP